MNLWLSVWQLSILYLGMRRSPLPIQCSSAVEIEGLENGYLRRFPSVGKTHWSIGTRLWRQCVPKVPLQYVTGIQKYVLDWLGNQIGGTEEPPPQKKTD